MIKYFSTQFISVAKAMLAFYLFWFLVFQMGRSIFLWYHVERLTDNSWKEVLQTFWNGWPMDLSATSYIMALPVLFIIAGLWIRIPDKMLKGLEIYFGLLLAIVIAATISDMEVYSYWGAKLNYEALSYLRHPKEALASSETSPIVPLLLSIAILFYVANKIFGKYVFPYFKISPTEISIRNNILNLLSSSFLIGLIIIGIRGGLGLAPMGGGHAYFSNKQFLNHAATNASWSFMYSIQQQNWGSPCNYHFMDDQKAEAFLDEFKSYNKNDTAQIIGSVQPNIVLILLEGWPAHITGALGGEKEVTPFFDSLSSEGILFSNIYSSGDRTFKGIPSVLSGFPAFPSTSIIKYIRKMEKLPCIASSLTEEGYDTHFIYGGDLEFKSISSFITHCGYEHITEDSDFEMELALESKWGVHDHHMFERAASEINSLQEPFLSTVVTLSSHEPYEVPMKTVFPGTERSEQFKNSVYYADWSLRKFFEKIEVEEWFDNTIFLLVSDHGRPYPEQVEHWMPEAFKIPALLVGEPILDSYSGLIVDKIGSQLDLVTTLLDIVNTNREAYFWGRNLLDESILPFAYYSFENGIGSVSPKGSVIYDRISGQLINPTTNLSARQKLDFERQKAYLQTLCRIYDEL